MFGAISQEISWCRNLTISTCRERIECNGKVRARKLSTMMAYVNVGKRLAETRGDFIVATAEYMCNITNFLAKYLPVSLC